MKNRPLVIKAISLLYFLSPIGITIQLLWLYNIKLTKFWIVFDPIYWNWQVILLLITTPFIGYAIWVVRKWGYYALIAHSALLIINNLVVYFSHLTFLHYSIIIFFNIALLSLIVVFVRKEVYAPYFNPNLRWWEQAPRYIFDKMKIYVKEFGTNNLLFEAKSFDVSETGSYITGDGTAKMGEIYSLEIHLGDTILYADGEIVWVNNNVSERYPKGFGCKFLAINKVFRKTIRYYFKGLGVATR